MALVRLSDIVEPRVFMDYQSVNTKERTAFWTSGIVVDNPMLQEKANSGGRIVDVPFWKDLGNNEANISSDDPAVLADPLKLGTGDQIARIHYLNQAWSAADLASEIAGSNALGRIRDRVEAYWTRQWQRRLISMLRGIQASNVANNSGDMVRDVSTDAVGAPTAAELFSRVNFTSAAFTLGDAFEDTGVIAVHSVVYKRMVDNDDIDFIADSQGRMVIPTFLGKRIIIDDGLPAIAGTNRIRYTSILFGAGAIGHGEGTPPVPVEVNREPGQGNGGGVELLYTRKTWLTHPFGFAFNSTTVSGQSPNLANLALAANWSRVVDERKQVPIAFLVTNG